MAETILHLQGVRQDRLLLRGEPLELVARETNVSIARLTEWRERAAKEPLRAVVNSGWTRGCGVLRCDGDSSDLRLRTADPQGSPISCSASTAKK